MLFSALCRFAACHLLATRVESHPDPNYTGMNADLTDILQQSEVPAKCFFVASTGPCPPWPSSVSVSISLSVSVVLTVAEDGWLERSSCVLRPGTWQEQTGTLVCVQVSASATCIGTSSTSPSYPLHSYPPQGFFPFRSIAGTGRHLAVCASGRTYSYQYQYQYRYSSFASGRYK